MPKPGDVYFHSKFLFEDGNIGEKLVVVLNELDNCSLCLVLRTTSHFEKYPTAVLGCNPKEKIYFIPKEWQSFICDTCIQLFPIYPIPLDIFIKNGIDK